MASIETLIVILTVTATATMAASAALQGVRQAYDPFGTCVLAVVTAVGGGTLRDLLIGATPVFWLQDMVYLVVAVPVGLIIYFLGKKMSSGGGKRLALLLYLDAIGLALFTLVGVQKALDFGIAPLPAVILGTVTGVVGGILRDILCGLQPVILKEDLYATISLAGGCFYLGMLSFISSELSLTLAFAGMILVRFIVILMKVA